MPHAENDMSAKAMTNGEKPQSKTLSVSLKLRNVVYFVHLC